MFELNETQGRNQLTFSPDLQRMMQIKSDGRCVIKQLQMVDEVQKIVKWQNLYAVNNMPERFLVTNHNFMFTPDFEYYLDVVYTEEEFVVVETKTKINKYRISKHLFSIVPRGQERSQSALAELVRKIKLLDSERIRILNKDGIDCVYNFTNEKVESFCKIDKLASDAVYKHFYEDRSHLPFYASSKRLA